MGQQKQLANELAIEWWASSNKAGGICDRCSNPIEKGEGYLCKPMILGFNLGGGMTDLSGLPDLICEACFDSSPTAEPFLVKDGSGKYALEGGDREVGGSGGSAAAQKVRGDLLESLNAAGVSSKARAQLLMDINRVASLLPAELAEQYWNELEKNKKSLEGATLDEFNKMAKARSAPAAMSPGLAIAQPAWDTNALKAEEDKLNKQWLPIGKEAAYKNLAEKWLAINPLNAVSLVKRLKGADQGWLLGRLAKTGLLGTEDWDCLFADAPATSSMACLALMDDGNSELNLSAKAAAILFNQKMNETFTNRPELEATKQSELKEKNLAICARLIKNEEKLHAGSGLPLIEKIISRIDSSAKPQLEGWSTVYLDLFHFLQEAANIPGVEDDLAGIMVTKLQPYLREFALSYWYSLKCLRGGDTAQSVRKLEAIPGISYSGRLLFLMVLSRNNMGAEALAQARLMPGADLLVPQVMRSFLDNNPEKAQALLTAADFEGDMIGQLLLCPSAAAKCSYLQSITAHGSQPFPNEMWPTKEITRDWIGIALGFMKDSTTAYQHKIQPKILKEVPVVKLVKPEKQTENIALLLSYEFWKSEKLDLALYQALSAWKEQAPGEVEGLLRLVWKKMVDEKDALESLNRDWALGRCQAVFPVMPGLYRELVIEYVRKELVEKSSSEYRNGQMYTVSLKPSAPFIHLLLAAQKVSGSMPKDCDELLTMAVGKYSSSAELMAAAAELYASDKGLQALTPPVTLKDPALLDNWEQGVVRAYGRKLVTQILIAASQISAN